MLMLMLLLLLLLLLMLMLMLMLLLLLMLMLMLLLMLLLMLMLMRLLHKMYRRGLRHRCISQPVMRTRWQMLIVVESYPFNERIHCRCGQK
jgi:hypothetical protein